MKKLSKVELLHLFRWFTHTPRSSGAFLEDALRCRKLVFSQRIKIYQEVQELQNPMNTCAVVSGIVRDLLACSVALSQNIGNDSQPSTQVRQAVPE